MDILKPGRILFLSNLIWLLFFTQIPGEYQYNGSFLYPVLTIFLFLVFFVFGLTSLKSKAVKTLRRTSLKKLKQITYFLFLIGLIGVLLKIYVGFFKTGIFLAQDSFELRLENMGKELTGGGIGILGSLLFPFSFVVLLIIVYNYKIFNNYFLGLGFSIGFYPFIETIFMGGRTIIALLGTTIIFVCIDSYRKNSKIPSLKIKFLKVFLFNFPQILLKRKVLIPSLIMGILFLSYSIDVIDKRLSKFNYGNKTLKVWEQKNYQWIKFDKEFKKEYYTSSSKERTILIGLYSFKHYFAHGTIEYIRLVNHLEKVTGYYYGEYQFNVFFKFFRAFGSPLQTMQEMQSVLKRKAVYTTFWGPFYLDFGLFGIVIIFFWGRFVKRVYIYSKRGRTEYVIFYAFLSTIIVTSAFINFLLGSSSYYFFAFFITALLFKYWPNNLVLKINK
jgi:hypothetical protein